MALKHDWGKLERIMDRSVRGIAQPDAQELRLLQRALRDDPEEYRRRQHALKQAAINEIKQRGF